MIFEKGHIPWNKGKHCKCHSEETKRKMSEAHKRKIGLANKRKYPEKLKQKIRREYASRVSYGKLAIKYHINHKAVKVIVRGIELNPIFCLYCGKLFSPCTLQSKFCSYKCTYAYKCKILGWFYGWKEKLGLIDYLGGECVNCGEKDHRILQVNHIYGGGNKDFKKNKSRVIYRQILDKKREGEFDLRFANCNLLYEYERGIKRRLEII